MKLGNDASAYTQDEIDDMAIRIAGFMDNLKQLDEVLDSNLKLVSKPEPTVRDNVIYLDMKVFAEYERLIEVEMPMHDIVDLYEEWSIRTLRTAEANAGNYMNNKLLEFVVKMRFILHTFKQFFAEA